jgi:hypothetical protein
MVPEMTSLLVCHRLTTLILNEIKENWIKFYNNKMRDGEHPADVSAYTA